MAFSKLKDLRVVRIAVHPELTGRGLGSLALQRLCEEARRMALTGLGPVLERTLSLWIFGLRMALCEARMGLDVDAEAKLIARCLQARSWGLVARVFKTQSSSLKAEVRPYIAKMAAFYNV